MALDDPALPYGLRDVKLVPINSNGSLGTPVDLPASQTLSFEEAEEFETLRGDDRDVAIHGKGPKVNWELEAGGISFDAWEVLTGGTVSETGSTPNQSKSFIKKVTDARPYFQIQGQSINDVDGDTHVVIYKCKVTESMEGEWADGQFFITSCSGEALGNADDDLYEITWNETATPLDGPSGVNEIQQIISNASGGTWSVDFDSEGPEVLAWNASAAAVQVALETMSAVGDFSVTGVPGNWTIEFIGDLAATNVATLTIVDVDLTGGGIAIQVIRQGSA